MKIKKIYISKIHKTDAHLFNYMLIHLTRVLLDSWIQGFMDIKKSSASLKHHGFWGKAFSESDALIKKACGKWMSYFPVMSVAFIILFSPTWRSRLKFAFFSLTRSADAEAGNKGLWVTACQLSIAYCFSSPPKHIINWIYIFAKLSI